MSPSHLRANKPSPRTGVFSLTEGEREDCLAVLFFVDENLGNVFVPLFASSGVRGLSGGARTSRNVVGAARDSHCAHVPGIKSTTAHIAHRFRDLIISKNTVRLEKALEQNGDFWAASR